MLGQELIKLLIFEYFFDNGVEAGEAIVARTAAAETDGLKLTIYDVNGDGIQELTLDVIYGSTRWESKTATQVQNKTIATFPAASVDHKNMGGVLLYRKRAGNPYAATLPPATSIAFQAPEPTKGGIPLTIGTVIRYDVGQLVFDLASQQVYLET